MTLLARERQVAALEGRLAVAGPVRSRFTDDFNAFVRGASELGDDGFREAMRRLASRWSSHPLTKPELDDDGNRDE